MEFTTALAFMKGAKEVFSFANDADKKRRELKGAKKEAFENAQMAVMEAITETRLYIESFKAGRQEYPKNKELVRLWREASRAIRQFDKSFAVDLVFKSDYWADPNNPVSKKKARELDSLLQDLTEMIDPKRKPSSDEDIITLKLNS
jgi:hypothetical protein